MKKLSILLLFLSINTIVAQDSELMVQNLNGTSFDLNKLVEGEENQPVIFFTWAQDWCWPCVKALDVFNDEFTTLQEQYKLKLVALNLDSEYSRQEIKKFINDRGWDFDVYVDPNRNYMTATNTTSAPVTFFIFNNEVVTSLSGFVDGVAEPESTADYFIQIIKDYYSNILYFDEDWKNTTKEYATYVRYRDKIGGKYEVTDRWITGEIQMRGAYTDFHCTKQIGEFKWYNKDGSISSTLTY
jgi:peroxiredoxin